MLPCLIYEDDHLLVVNKPAGLNTHAPSPYAGEGIYDWLRHREPRWSGPGGLAILHRLDKETSGVLVFGKTTLANRSLAEQFEQHRVRKKYLLLTDRPMPQPELVVKSRIRRAGERYVSGTQGEPAETRFRAVDSKSKIKNAKLVEAQPLTGRTHQIRVHAAESGFPILGDTLYGGTRAPRLFLHAIELTLQHPASAQDITFCALADFEANARLALRAALIEPEATNAFRLIHGASDGWPGWYVDRLGDYLLSQSESPLDTLHREELARLQALLSARSVYHKTLTRQARCTTVSEASPRLVLGETAPERFSVRENGVQFELSFTEGYSVGLFLDQRDNRRRFLTGHIASGLDLQTEHGTRNTSLQILNAFAYTCGFSVCAALGGARTTSLDLSKKYLEWGRRNFALNGLDPAEHDFIYGDVFDWLKRLAKKARSFDVVALDPPTFSQSKAHGAFRAEKDYGKLVATALPLLKPGGMLFTSTNAAGWSPESFLASVESAVQAARRKILQRHYAPQPPDFPISRAEPAYLKTIWLRIG